MALVLGDRIKETTSVVGGGPVTLVGAAIGFQAFALVGNGNTTYYCIADQGGANWEVGIGTYSTTGPTLSRTTVLASSNAGGLVNFGVGIKDVFCTYPAEKSVNLDASGNATGLGTPATFVGTNITGTAAGLTAGGTITNANLAGAVTSVGNTTSLGSFTSAQLRAALTDETGTGANVFATSPTLVTPALGTPSALVGTNITGTAAGLTAGYVTTNANLTGAITSTGNATILGTASFTSANLAAALTDETGSGANVFATSPTLVTPNIGAATGTSLVATSTITGAELLASNGLVLNNTTIGTSYTLPTGYNASSVGPVTVSGGIVITVPSGQRWVVL